MSGERVTLTDGSCLVQLMEMKDFRGVVSGMMGDSDFRIGQVHQGFGSSGAVIESDARRLFLRVPETETVGVCPKQLLHAYYLSGNKGVFNVVLVGHEGEIEVMNYPPDAAGDIDPSTVPRLSPRNPRYVAQMLEVLPEGVPLTQLLVERPTDGRWAYYNLGQELGALHNTNLKIDKDREALWRCLAVRHPIEGLERFDVVAEVIAGDIGKGWVFGEQLGGVRSMMDRLAMNQLQDRVLLTRIHGDAWRDNVWMKDAGGVQLFDNALAVGYPGYDLAFAIGDQIVTHLLTEDPAYSQRADAFITGYEEVVGEDGLSVALREAFVPFAFKLVVGAAFDLNDDLNCERQRLLVTASNLLKEKLSQPGLLLSRELIWDAWSASENEQ